MKNRTRARRTRTPANIASVAHNAEEKPGLSIPRCFLELGISQMTLHRILWPELKDMDPVWENFMALASARPDCLVSSSGAEYKTWSGAGQNCKVFVFSAARQRLASGLSATSHRLLSLKLAAGQLLTSHKRAASQPLIRNWLATNWWSVNKVFVKKSF